LKNVGWLLMRVCLSCCLCSDITSLSTRKAVVGPPPPSISKPVELQTKISLAEIVAPVAEDLVVLNDNLQLVCLLAFLIHVEKKFLEILQTALRAQESQSQNDLMKEEVLFPDGSGWLL
jgi:hypothetical protein